MEDITDTISFLDKLLSSNVGQGLFAKLFSRKRSTRDIIQEAAVERVADIIKSTSAFPPALLEALETYDRETSFINLIRILGKAVPQITDQAMLSSVTDDWAANFRDKARTCFDDDMADIWAQLLAGEVNKPGSYSRKSVNILADMEPHDAQLFKAVADCKLIPVDPVVNNEVRTGVKRSFLQPKPMILDCTHSIYLSNGIEADSLERLDWLGLVNHGLDGMHITENLRMGATVAYEYRSGYLLLRAENKSVTVKFGCTSFTPAGIELSELCPMEHPSGFIEYLDETWSNEGILVSRRKNL